MAGYGEAKPAPDTLQMLLGKYLGEGAEAVGSIFPPSNPYGQAVKNFLLGDIPETASRLEEGEPYVLMDTRAGRQLIKPEALEVAGFLPVGEVAKGAGLAVKGAAPALGALGVIKSPGGNWIQKDIDDALSEVIWSSGLGHARPLEEVLRLKSAPAEEQESVYRMLATRPNEAEREALFDKELSRSAIREWLETKFNKYIKNEMGTERDPLRQLAESGVSMARPLEETERRSLQRFVPPARRAEGFPEEGLGQSDLAKDWELLTDIAITPRKSGELIGEQMGLKTAEELYPWLLKVPPETKTHSILEGQLPASMGVEDLAQTLKKYVSSPEIDPQARFSVEGVAPVQFPPELALKYSDLQKMNVPQVVERVAKMRDWEQQDIERKLLESTKKVMQENAQLHSPNFQLSFNKEPGGTWVQIPDTTDTSGKRVCTALGKAGGWCTQEAQTAEDYGSGSKRLVNFLDSSGRPHIQIQTVESSFGPRISEIKPVGNTFRSDRAVEYAGRDPKYQQKLTDELLNFLNEGNWGHVDTSSLYQFGIEDLASKAAEGGKTYEQLKEQGVPRFIKRHLEEYAQGGSVQIPDHTRIESIINDTLHMADGGEVDEPSLTDEARQKAAEALEGLKRMYEEATGKGWSENTLEGLKGTARAYTTDVLGMPVDLLTSLPVAPREYGNPYANAIRNLTESLGETPVGGSDWLAQKLGLYGEGLAHEAGRMFGPGAVKVFAPEKTVAKIFAGERAATADLEAKARAEKMLEEGATFEDIWAKTGWGLGPGGQWRFEIPDWEARTLEDKYSEYLKDRVASREPIYQNVGYFLEHPELKAAYPDVSAMDVILSADKKGGALTQSIPEWAESLKHPLDFTEITAGYDPTTGAADKSVLLHELQHAVQKMESTPYGGSSSEFAQGPMRPKAQNILEDVGQTALGFRPYGVREVTESLGHALPEGMEEVLKKYGFKDPEDLKRYLEYEDLRRTPFGQYQRLAGEAEARLTQARAGMSPGERRVTYPWNPDYFREQTGIPLEDLIYRYENEGPSELITYHGTPHRFPATERNPLGEFDASKIGTGEGAQAYGHGIYLAEAPGVASGYKKTLSKPELFLDDNLLDIEDVQRRFDTPEEVAANAMAVYKDPEEAAKALREAVKTGRTEGEKPEKYLAGAEWLDKNGHRFKYNEGSLYTVDLPDEMIDRMLDWHKPFSEQPKSIQDALKRRITTVEPIDKFDMGGNSLLRDNRMGQYDKSRPYPWILESRSANGTSAFGLSQKDVDRMFGDKNVADLTGSQIISRLAQKQGSQAAASEYLRQLGIPGIKYFDKVSRDAGEGTRNFVIFPGEEKNLNILERKARGGAVDYDPDKIQRIMASVLE